MTQTLTHWKKNLDSRYISGEDLIAELNGLKKEMIVSISRFLDTETFDQNNQSKKVVTGLYLADQSGKEVYKPVILNRTNAKFFEKETNSPHMEHWVGIPVILYAQKDSRHGHVVRFKKYVMPTLVKDSKEFDNCYKAIHSNGFTIDQIRQKYVVSSELEKLLLTPPKNG